MSTPRQEVIDLTGDASGSSSRPSGSRQYGRPNFPSHARIARTPTPSPSSIRNVISIDDHDDTPGSLENAGSPEVELLFTRTLLPTTMPHSRPHGAGPPVSGRPASPPPLRSATNFNQTVDGRLSWAEWRNQPQRARRFDMPLLPQDMYPERHRRQEVPRGAHGLLHAQFLRGGLFRDSMFMNGNPNFELPADQLDFGTQGFAMDPGNQAAENARARPAPPTYDAPPPPRTGYTRDPTEEDILLCPNCEEELGMGKDDTKKQVWVIRKCGHVCFTLSPKRNRGRELTKLGLLRGMYKASAEIRKGKGTATWLTQTVLQVRGRIVRGKVCQPFHEFFSGLLVMVSQG